MRECIYCGKTLEKGEQCSCAMSVRKRQEKQASQKETSSKTKDEEKQEQKARKKAEKAHKKEERKRQREERAAKSRAAYQNYSARGNNIFGNLWQNIKAFFKSPIETLMNPLGMGKSEIFLLAALEGFISSWCIFSAISGATRGVLSLLGRMIGFRGMAGYSFLHRGMMYSLSGAVGGVLLFLICSAVFYAIGKWIFRVFATFWDYAKRLVFAMLPMTIISGIGFLLGIFSPMSFISLILCGLIGNVILTYEVLKTMWSSKSASRVLYALMLGTFIILTIVMYIVRLSTI